MLLTISLTVKEFFVAFAVNNVIDRYRLGPLSIVEHFPLRSLIKLSSLTNGNLKKNDKAINETNVSFIPFKLTAT